MEPQVGVGGVGRWLVQPGDHANQPAAHLADPILAHGGGELGGGGTSVRITQRRAGKVGVEDLSAGMYGCQAPAPGGPWGEVRRNRHGPTLVARDPTLL